MYSLLLPVIVLSSSDVGCKWTSPSGTSYDFSSLYREEGWKLDPNDESELFGLAYYFNFCGTHPKECNGVQSGAFEFLEIMGEETDTCEILGDLDY